jgi:putative ABC transport system permease protein
MIFSALGKALLRVVLAVESFWQDVRHGIRLFAKSPGFTVIAVLSIAFGTGANVAVFSLADTLLLRPLPVARPSELITVGSRITLGLVTTNLASYADYLDIRDRTTSFSGLAAFEFVPVALTLQPGGDARMRMATIVSDNFFHVMGVEPTLGRGFLADETRVSDRNTVAVLSHELWSGDFARDPGVIGRHIRVAGVDCTIVGVAPEGFTGVHQVVRAAVYLPIAMWPRLSTFAGIDPLTARDFRELTVKGRLNTGVSLADAQAELMLIGRELEQAFPDTNRNQLPTAETEFDVNWERRPLDVGLVAILTILSTAVLCVACANVAALLASRGPARAREMALRLAIGAGRARLVRQLLAESLTIALLGTAGGLLIGQIGIALLRQIQFPTDIITPPIIQLDGRALYFSLAVAAITALLVGLGPAIHTTRVNLAASIKSVDMPARGRIRLSGRRLLVSLQVALCLVLVTIAVFAFQLFRNELRRGPGFRTTHMVKATLNPVQVGRTGASSIRFFEQLLDNTRQFAGVRSASATSNMPLFSFAPVPLAPEGFQLPEGQPGIFTVANDVEENYFATTGIPLLAGRSFSAADTADSQPVAIVNERFARHYWPGQNPLGRRFRVTNQKTGWITIVGIAKTTTYTYPAEAPQDAVYFPFRQRGDGAMVMLIETAGDSAAMLGPLTDLFKRSAPGVPFYDVQTIEAFYDARVTSLASVLIRLVAGMGIMGVILTMVGLYGLVSYSVSRRTHEIGIRMAIGATPRSVIAMVLRQGLRPVWWGLGFGVILSIAAVRRLPAMVHIIYTIDTRLFPGTAVLLFAVVLLAAFVPARRAAAINPTNALRYD